MTHFSAGSLRRAIGHDLFYSIVAELDPIHAREWIEMVDVQATFKRAEPGYNADALAYSQSMRLTLHWAMVFTFENPATLRDALGSDGGLYGYFIRLHATAFKANGACTLNPLAMANVTFNTSRSMITPQNLGWIGEGLRSRYEAAIQAARHVRSRRQAGGLPVTQDGYRTPRRMTPLERRTARHGRTRALRYAS